MTKSRMQNAERLRVAWDQLAWGLGDIRHRLIASGVWPARDVVAVSPSGDRSRVIDDHLVAPWRSGEPGALLVPESQCLWGDFALPDMPRQALAAAIEEAMWRVSPLPTDQVVSAWSAKPNTFGGWAVSWGLCQRSVLEQGLLEQGLLNEAPVFLANGADRAYAVVQGASALGGSAERRRLDALALGTVALLVAAFALPLLMPLVLKRQDVVRAVQHVSAVEPMAAPLRQKLDELHQQAKVAEELRQGLDASLPLGRVVDRLAVALPDDTSLERFEVNGTQIRIMGLTGNAAELIALIGKQPNFTEVRTTAPTVRDEGQRKERFSFEMRWQDKAGQS